MNNALKEVINSIVYTTTPGVFTFEFQPKEHGRWVRAPETWNSWELMVNAVSLHHKKFPDHSVKLIRL